MTTLMQAANEYRDDLYAHFAAQGLNPEEIREAFASHGTTRPLQGVEFDLAMRHWLAECAAAKQLTHKESA